MARKNHRGGKPQARRGERGAPVQRGPRPPRVPVESMVIPKGRCYKATRNGKLMFAEADVEKALRHAQIVRERTLSGRREERAYPCEGCGHWHLTGMKDRPRWAA